MLDRTKKSNDRYIGFLNICSREQEAILHNRKCIAQSSSSLPSWPGQTFQGFGGEQSQHRQDVDKEGKKSNKPDLRILPTLVVDLVFKGALLVSGVLVANIQDLGIVKYLMVEAKDLLILAIHGDRSHFCRRKVEDVPVELGKADCRPSSSKV